MLQALRITQFAVIQEAEVCFGPGLTVFTGETGAGKSILIDALSLLLGGRADPESVRSGADEASVEGVFLKTMPLHRRLEELGLPDLGEELCVRRTVHRSGRGKAYVNGALVTVGVLGKLMRGAVDIAGQHEHMALFDPGQQAVLLDRLPSVEPLLGEYRQAFSIVQETQHRIDALGSDDTQALRRAEFIRFQLEELDRVAPKEGEDLLLEGERRKLGCSEKRRQAVSSADGLLTSDGAVLEGLGKVCGLVGEAAKVDALL